MPLYQTIVVTSVREEIPGVKTFLVSYENGNTVPYTAGQFITLVFTHHGKEERRSFSISSSPALNEPLSFTVKRLENGAYSRYLIEKIKPGDKLQTTGAAGLFTLPENGSDIEQVFFFAAGIGITPIISLIKTLLFAHPGKSAVLIYSNRSKEDVVFYNEIQSLTMQFPGRFKAEMLYSSAFNLLRARLNKELLPQLLKEYAFVPKEKMLFYVCGPFPYMRMAILSLEEQGMHTDQIKKENFNPNDKKTSQIEPPDKSTHEVTLLYEGKTYRFAVAYPDTILQAAKRHGLLLPYSCEVGRCGSCAAMCISGNVWLSYNEVLMDSDLKKGMILTCVGHPVNGDVTIKV